MWNYSHSSWNQGPWSTSSFGGVLTSFLIPLVFWSLAWKGWALWRAAKNDSKPWFIALLLINTMGILEILYIFVFGKEKPKSSKKK